MKKTKTNIPELRFPGFEGVWEEKKLGEIFSVFKSGQSITSQLISPDDIYPVYGGNGLRGYTSTYTHDGQYILIGRQGALCGNVLLVNGRNYISEHAIAANTNIENSNELLSYRLDYLNLNRLSESSAQPGLSVYKLEKVKIHLPNLIEQGKIASFLGAVDQKIEQLEKMVALQEKYKKGMMQRIFNQEIRFKSSNGTPFPAWQQKKLGDIGTINPICKELPLKFIYIDLESVSKGQLLNEKVIERDDAPIRAQRLLLEGDIIFQSVRPYQRNNLFFKKELKLPAVASTGYVQIRTKINSEYLFFALHTDQFNIEVLNACTGTSYPAISASDLANIKVIIPVLEEQKKIAGFLSALDEKIVQSKTKLDKVREWKTGLMQRLFI